MSDRQVEAGAGAGAGAGSDSTGAGIAAGSGVVGLDYDDLLLSDVHVGACSVNGGDGLPALRTHSGLYGHFLESRFRFKVPPRRALRVVVLSEPGAATSAGLPAHASGALQRGPAAKRSHDNVVDVRCPCLRARGARLLTAITPFVVWLAGR